MPSSNTIYLASKPGVPAESPSLFHRCSEYTRYSWVYSEYRVFFVLRVRRVLEYWRPKLLGVLGVWAVLMAHIPRVLGLWAVHMLEYKQYPQYKNLKYLEYSESREYSTPTYFSIRVKYTPSNTLTNSTSQYKTLKYCEYYCTLQWEILKYSEYWKY